MNRYRRYLYLLPFSILVVASWAFSQPIGAVRFLAHYIPPSGGSYVSGCWGWTDTVSHREYAILGSYCGTSIVEITNSASPIERSFIPGVCSIWREIQVWSHYAYVVSEGGGGTQIIDLSYLPDSAHLVKNFTYSQSGNNTSRSHSLHIRDGYMYLNGCAGWSAGGIVIFSLADPVNPVYQSAYEQRYVHDCFVRNDTIYAATINNGGIDIVDVRVKTNPQFLYRFTYTGAGTHNCATTTDGKYLLTTDEINSTPKTLKIWNLQTAPSFPKVAEYQGSPTAIVHNVFVKGNLAVMSYYTAGLRVVDITDPTHPVEVGGYDTYPSGDPSSYNGAWSAYPFFPSGQIIIGDEDSGLYIVDLDYNAPNLPAPFSAYSDYQTPTSVTLTWTDPSTLVSGAPLSNFKIHIYRDGAFIAEVDSGVQTYIDGGRTQHQYYTYTLGAVVPSDSSGATSAGAYAGGHAQPQPPAAFNVVDATGGILLTWTNPSRQLDNTPLNDLAEVLIYRDGLYVHSISQTSADTGQNRSYLDSVVGYHSYTIQVSDNEAPTHYSTFTPTLTGYGGLFVNYNEGFESSLETIYRTGTWDSTSSIAASGEKSFTDSPVGNYADGSVTYFQTPPVVLGTNPILQFSHIAIIAFADFGFVEISKDGRKTFSVLKVYNMTMHPEWQDSHADPGDWFTDAFTLSAYAGDTVAVRFRLSTNGTNNADGWYIDDLFIGDPPLTATVSSSVVSDWNLVSLPVGVADGRTAVVYPSATSHAFAFEGSAYTIKDTLDPGVGYWVKFGSPTSITLTGSPIRRDTVDVQVGWNIIGSITSRINVAAVKSIPTGIVTSSYYGFNGSYVASSTIEPGEAYWVKTSQAGKLVLTSFQNNAEPIAPPEKGGVSSQLNALTFTDAENHTQTLYYIQERDGIIAPERFDLPPSPPEGAFDVRFASQRLLAMGNTSGADEFPITMQGVSYPLTIKWNIHEQAHHGGQEQPFTLNIDGKEIVLRSRGQAIIAHQPLTMTLTTSAFSSSVPLKFALEPNYPNPFNPMTTFGLRIADVGWVTLKVYDILGRELATLVNEEKLPGSYTATWDAGNTPSSIYYARMMVTNSSGKQLYQATRKIVLMK
ncbi:MAG: choice-of-anchor B family protein [Ignavibacteria bacterium]|nr:choice-of-anchor B family protein [Ignavibacteria bacterium]